MPESYSDAVLEMFRIISEYNERLYPGKTAAIYLAGGAAVHFYSNARVSEDVDAIMEPYRPGVPEDLEVVWKNEDGEVKALSFDYQYNPTLGLLHEDYQERAFRWKRISESVDLFVLHPIDLVITKLTRYSDADEQDIEMLVQSPAFDIDIFEKLANHALEGAVGVPSSVRHHIDWVKQLFEEKRCKLGV